jgi:hypothetical protein
VRLRFPVQKTGSGIKALFTMEGNIFVKKSFRVSG